MVGMGANERVTVTNMRFSDRLYPGSLLQDLSDLRDNDILCDVSLVVNEEELKAHKAVLAAASPYFRAMFNCKMIESKQDKIYLQENDFRALKDVLQFIYTAKIELTDENVYPVLELCDILQLSALRPMCAYYLSSTLKPSNCLSVYTTAKMHGYHDLASAAFKYTLCNFSAVIAEDELMLVSEKTLADVLDSNLLAVKNEGELLEAVLRWMKHSPDRVSSLVSLVPKLKLVAVPVEHLLRVKTEPEVEGTVLQTAIADTVNQILAQRYDSVCRQRLWKLEPEPRSCRYAAEEPVLFVMGGYFHGHDNSGVWASVECFAASYEGWRCMLPNSASDSNADDARVIPSMGKNRHTFAVAADDYQIYVVGGRNCTVPISSLERYNVNTNEWTSLAPMPSTLNAAAAALVDGDLMVVGGWVDHLPQNRLWSYRPQQDKWVELPPMRQARAELGAVCVAGQLYVIGGRAACGELDGPQSGITLASVERFSPCSGRWHQLAPLHQPRCALGCVALSGYVYALGGRAPAGVLRSVERLNTLTGDWCFLTSMGVPRSDFAVSCMRGRIYCMGGSDGVHLLATAEKYNTRTDRWHCMHTMQMVRAGAGGASLFVPCGPAPAPAPTGPPNPDPAAPVALPEDPLPIPLLPPRQRRVQPPPPPH